MNRGDIVIIKFPYVDGGRGKNRPALIVQNDRDNARLANTIVAMITGNLSHVGESTQGLVDPNSPEGKSSGLHGPSAVKCCNLFTVAQADIFRVIGRLSGDTMERIERCLKAALEIQ